MDQHRTVSRPAGHVLVEALIEQGITEVFGVPIDMLFIQ
jgi:acetolactate synthase I/II/III large subunit